jgi:hypothetical protein
MMAQISLSASSPFRFKSARTLIDMIAPDHGRTSCSDENLSNGFFQIEETELRGVTIKREWKTAPRCNRCFLLKSLKDEEYGIPTDPRIVINAEISLNLRQPEFEIKRK